MPLVRNELETAWQDDRADPMTATEELEKAAEQFGYKWTARNGTGFYRHKAGHAVAITKRWWTHSALVTDSSITVYVPMATGRGSAPLLRHLERFHDAEASGLRGIRHIRG